MHWRYVLSLASELAPVWPCGIFVRAQRARAPAVREWPAPESRARIELRASPERNRARRPPPRPSRPAPAARGAPSVLAAAMAAAAVARDSALEARVSDSQVSDDGDRRPRALGAGADKVVNAACSGSSAELADVSNDSAAHRCAGDGGVPSTESMLEQLVVESAAGEECMRQPQHEVKVRGVSRVSLAFGIQAPPPHFVRVRSSRLGWRLMCAFKYFG
jgi:hypothetical protein